MVGQLSYVTCFLLFATSVCTAQTWEETPQDVQVEYGSEVVLDCKLSGLIVVLARWVKLSETDDSSVDLAIGTLENVNWVEVIYDAATGSYQLKLPAVDYSREGRYQCVVANADPQGYTAKVGVWSPLSSPSVDGEVEESVDVPMSGEALFITRTCTVSNVKPKADLTWMYSITSDAGTNIVGELPYDFASGSLPNDDVPEGVDNYVVVTKTETENDDGTTDTESALSVTYTSGADSTGLAEENLKIEVKCKAKQTGYVEERDTVSSAVTVSVSSICTAQTWEETPQDVQVEYGSEVVLDCKLCGLLVALARWVKLSETDDSSVDLAFGTLENEDWVEVIYDAATGSYQLKLSAVDYSREGRYQCTVANAEPQSYTAKVGVWSPLSSPSVDGEVEESVDVPMSGEALVITRTCTVSNVKPKADLTWMYSITSDAGTNIVGELPYDFASGSLPNDDVPEGVDNNVVVTKTETENDDGTLTTESVLEVTYTSGADSTGLAEENLKIEVKCKAKQTGYVEERDTVSSAVTVSVSSICTAQTWEETPQDVQVEYGSEVVLDCKLSGLIVALARWVKLSETDDSSVDLTIGTLENVNWVEVIYDAATGSYQLKLPAVDYSREGRYQCVVVNANPQGYTAKVGVWSPLSSPSVDGEVEESVDVPMSGEALVITRTCTASNVKPKADLTWMYSITSDAGTNIVGELPFDFASGSLPDDDVPEGVDNYVVVTKTETENDDGTTDTESALEVTYTSGADSTGQTEENLKIEVKCKAKQTGYVEERDTVSSAVTVSVISICTAQTWEETPQDVQVEYGSEVVLDCKLCGLLVALARWAKLSETDESTVDLTVGTLEYEDWAKLNYDAATGSYQLKLPAVDYSREGRYQCTVANAEPQSYTAKVGVWSPLSSPSVDGEVEESVDVPKNGEEVVVSRTCTASNVKPKADLTWMYSITSDAGTNIVGELPYDFASGSLPNDNVPEGVDNYVVVTKTETENDDGTLTTESVLEVTYTSGADSTGQAEENLKIEVKCKAKQTGYVEERDTVSSAVTVSVISSKPQVNVNDVYGKLLNEDQDFVCIKAEGLGATGNWIVDNEFVDAAIAEYKVSDKSAVYRITYCTLSGGCEESMFYAPVAVQHSDGSPNT
ncbi:uncharacterized protein LOC144439702 [Glandiceps talaboti]